MHTKAGIAQNSSMDEEEIFELYVSAASAEECTGLLQKISIDPLLLRRYHDLYNAKDKE